MCYTVNMTKHVKLTDKQEETFVEVLAATNSPSKAVLAMQPELVAKKNYAAVKGQQMLKRKDIQEKIQLKLEKMAPKANKRIESLIMSDNEQVATVNSWRVIEHLRGKPVARNLNLNAKVNIEDALFD